MATIDRVAVIGTGRMGGAMVGTLRSAGYDVMVYNRSTGKAEAVAEATGATVAATPAEAARSARIVLSSLADDRAVIDTHTGPDGTITGLGSDSVLVETSTIDPETLHSIEPAVSAQGATLLDGPVSGSVPLVEQGKLTFMVGGNAVALETVRPVLDSLSAKIFHVGDLGAGATIKLAVNAIVISTNVALAEALVLAERSGVDRQTAYEVFAGSAAASPFVAYKQAAFVSPEDAPVAFSVELVLKDLGLILGLGRNVGVPMEQSKANLTVTEHAVEAGYGDRDMSAVASYLRERSTG
ncbi:MAG: NAD(P)-dependent oxidoreductase [Actinobacteria bacterium]|nr:NAD(P)-dependent oxidoreductase [Actinomycetota bacterium]